MCSLHIVGFFLLFRYVAFAVCGGIIILYILAKHMIMSSSRSKKKTRLRVPQRHKEAKHEQSGHARKGLTVCRQCHNVLFRKEWHHPGSKIFEQARIAQGGVQFTLCPACSMVRDRLYEGEIIIRNIPAKYESEMVRFVIGYGARAQKRDPQDRVIEIKKTKGGYRITTTENQLAVRMAKKIKRVFGKTELSISYAKEPYQTSRVVVTFL